MEGDNNNEHDLGLDIQIDGAEGTSIFEQFHSTKKADANAEAVIKTGEEEEEENGEGADKGEGGDKTKVKATGAASSGKADKNKELVQTLIKNSMGNDNEEEEEEESADGNKAGGAPAAKKKANAPDGNTFKALYEHFTTEMGYQTLPEGEDVEEWTEDKFLDWQNKNIQTQAEVVAEEMITEAFKNSPENATIGNDLFRFLSAGGSINEFLETRKNDDITKEYLTTDDAELKTSRAELLLDRYYVSIGWDRDTIDKNMKKLKTAGILEDTAETVLPQFIKQRDQRKTLADQQAQQNKQRSQQQVKEFNQSIFKIIDESKEFLSFNLASPKEKAKLKEYMYTPTVELEDGRKVPQFVVDQQKAVKNPNYTLLRALTLMNKGLDLEHVKTKAANAEKVTLKNKLEQAASGIKNKQAGEAGEQQNRERHVAPTLDFENIEVLSF